MKVLILRVWVLFIFHTHAAISEAMFPIRTGSEEERQSGECNNRRVLSRISSLFIKPDAHLRFHNSPELVTIFTVDCSTYHRPTFAPNLLLFFLLLSPLMVLSLQICHLTLTFHLSCAHLIFRLMINLMYLG